MVQCLGQATVRPMGATSLHRMPTVNAVLSSGPRPDNLEDLKSETYPNHSPRCLVGSLRHQTVGSALAPGRIWVKSGCRRLIAFWSAFPPRPDATGVGGEVRDGPKKRHRGLAHKAPESHFPCNPNSRYAHRGYRKAHERIQTGLPQDGLTPAQPSARLVCLEGAHGAALVGYVGMEHAVHRRVTARLR